MRLEKTHFVRIEAIAQSPHEAFPPTLMASDISMGEAVIKGRINMETRKSTRKAARIVGKIRYGLQEVEGRVVNLSADGIALDLQTPLHAATGSQVKIQCDEIGYLEGMVRWCNRGRIGVRFSPTSNARAQVTSYFRFVHKDALPSFGRRGM